MARGVWPDGDKWETLKKSGISATMHRLISEGNIVSTASEGEFSGDHVAFYDLFRLDGDKIV
ncbi:hypothetical protein [Shewanella woodyi]|uniref:hypothetical protein n=1 Tax=Shewanella woodyi TaxID=60961 RepID=UPI0037484451